MLSTDPTHFHIRTIKTINIGILNTRITALEYTGTFAIPKTFLTWYQITPSLLYDASVGTPHVKKKNQPPAAQLTRENATAFHYDDSYLLCIRWLAP